MKVNKVNQLVSDVQTTLDQYSLVQIKRSIGDSTNNNRGLSVNQVLRFLSRKNPSLGKQLEVTYNRVRHFMWVNRLSTARTDAYEWNELSDVLDRMNGFDSWIRSLGQYISKAA